MALAVGEKKPREGDQVSPKDIHWICAAWNEMNIIRARDGVPRGSYVSQEHWDNVMRHLEDIILRESGHPAHCNPYLYL